MHFLFTLIDLRNRTDIANITDYDGILRSLCILVMTISLLMPLYILYSYKFKEDEEVNKKK